MELKRRARDPLAAADLVRRALLEDGAFQDRTGPLVGAAVARGVLLAKADLVVCGLHLAREAFRQTRAVLSPRVRDGVRVRKGTILARVSGPARHVLAAERVALNFLQQLSGVSTLTRRFVELARPAQVFDTRKTTPGLRVLEKYAVRCGGGHNHRMGLADGIMIKDNHIAAIGDYGRLREKVVALAAGGWAIVIEAQTLEEALLFALYPVEVLMLDNFSVPALGRAVPKIRALRPSLKIEASGGVTLKTVRAIARTGVDRVSVGALTHSAPAVDISLEL
jgi:nicotinate-nucleotide pyrophosphorylase (carboxylating)